MADSQATECFEGTRTTILDNVATKTNHCDGPNIIWIRGAPGCGKSSISLSAKSRLRSQGQLVTYFRFDRNDAATTTPTALWRRVAYDLARRLPSLRARLLQQLRDDKVALDSPMAVFTSLVQASLSDLTDAPPDRSLVIIIDALDECGGFVGRSSPERQVLLQTLGRWPKLPKSFKLLVTSRGEGDITRVLTSISSPIDIPSGHFLTDNPQVQVSIQASQDIHTFLEHRFRQIREPLTSLPLDWPGGNKIADMVHRAAGNFMWATTVSNFVDSGLDLEDRLERALRETPESKSMEPLYLLYFTVLETSFGDIAGDSLEAEMLHAVLGTMVLAQQPLRDIEYTKLPTSEPVKSNMVARIRDRLSSVVGQGPFLHFVHKSFDDFLLSDECPPKYRVRTNKTQRLLAKFCLTTMTAELHFNMCGLETSCLKNEDIPDIEMKITEGISSLLSYSCCFWADHLIRTTFDERLVGLVKDMVYDKLLYWFEAMSLLKEINRVSHSLLLLLKWCNSAMYGEFMDFISDAHRFIGAFGYPIAQSAPHIYISALPFAPEHSSVARRFLPQFPQILALSTGKPTDWPPCVFTSEHHLDDVNSIAFSPDEKFFVSGSSDETICTCDSETGNLISGPFRGTDWVASSFFDPDGRRVWASHLDGQVIGWDVETGDENVRFQAGGYFDVIGCRCFNSGRNVVSVSQEQGTVTLWNADTGERLRILVRTPTSGRSKVSFSPDGCYMAWAGNLNTAVRIWKLVEGGEIRGSSHSQPQLGHTQPISALSFSVDGHFVVSGSLDGTILVWDAETGDVVGDPLAPSKGKVRAVAYSHQNRVLVSASGMSGTIMVCNAATHEIVLGPLEGHTSDIMAIALSRDGRRALSASGDATVRMWDLSRNAVVPTTHANKGHTGWVRCVVFSPCGRKLTSVGIDETIRVWDASTGECFLGPIESLSHYERIIFSPDGSQIVAFGSTDGAIGAWNVNTGELAFEHDLSDDNYKDTGIEHVAFRSTDQRLVTCSSNGVVRIWSLEDGFLTEDLSVSSPWPEDDNEPVEILALSPDGLTAIVSDMNRNPRHYLWSTTTCQPLPLTFPHDELNSGDPVAFSPSGRFFAAASSNDDVTTLRIWNTRTGEQVVGPLWLNGELECLAFSPDDCHIAFCYFHFRSHAVTNSIWILDVHTGHLTSGPWKGHSDYVRVLAFPPDGDKLASGSIGGQIGIWNATDLLGHTQASSGVGTCMQDGWVMDASGDILFWVPKDHRSNLVWSHNIMVIGGSGIRTELDLGRFRYGRNWVKCLADRK